MKILKKLIAILINWFESKIRVLSLLFNGVLIDPRSIISGNGGFRIEKGTTVKKIAINLSQGDLAIEANCWLNSNIELNPSSRISIGKNTSVQKNVVINGNVIIESDVIIAPNVFISSTSHVFEHFDNMSIKRQDRLITKEEFNGKFNLGIVIGSGTWIGINVVIMPGITVGKNVIIGANSVVTKNIPDGYIAAGVPSKNLRKRKDISTSKIVYSFDVVK